MGTVVKATGISVDPRERSSIAHAAIAGKACIEAAGIRVDAIDYLINIGNYRDSNMVEPSMAALIQQELGLNLDLLKYETPKPAFSFDLMNGACGILNAIQVSRAYIELGEAEYVLIVSSDAHPSNQENVAGFPYATVGGAMLLSKSDNGHSGFGRIQIRSSKDEEGTVGFLDMVKAGPKGRDALSFTTHPEYTAKLVDLATRTAQEYVADEKIDLAKTLLVASHPSPEFAISVARNLGIADTSVVRLPDIERDPHTSALSIGYNRAGSTGQLAQHDKVLFLAAGAGMTSACAIYRL